METDATSVNDRSTQWTPRASNLLSPEVLRRHDPQAFDRVVRSPCLQTMLAAAAPFAGFESSQDYFAHENPVLFVQQAAPVGRQVRPDVRRLAARSVRRPVDRIGQALAWRAGGSGGRSGCRSANSEKSTQTH